MIDPMTYHRYASSEQEKDQPPVFRGIKLPAPTVGNIQDPASGLYWDRPRVARPPPPDFPTDPNMASGPSQRWQFVGSPRVENGPWAEYDNIIPGPDNLSLELIDKNTGKADMSRYLLCPPLVIGFDLKSRQWGK